MTKLRERMIHDLELGGYSPGTVAAYVRCVAAFADFHGRSPDTLVPDDVRAWVEHLRSRGLSPQRLGQHFAALRFLYRKTLTKPEMVSFLSKRSKPLKMPTVLSPEEVARVLGHVKQVKHRVLFTTIYATGLRISEACNLRTDDIDAARRVIRVRQGKGGKDRLVPLHDKLLSILRWYWKLERPAKPWLFAASRCDGPVRRATAQTALRRAAQRAGMSKRVSPHVLRHSFATSLLDRGVDLRVIQVVLGHSSLGSTARYASVSTGLLAKVPTPLDLLESAG